MRICIIACEQALCKGVGLWWSVDAAAVENGGGDIACPNFGSSPSSAPACHWRPKGREVVRALVHEAGLHCFHGSMGLRRREAT